MKIISNILSLAFVAVTTPFFLNTGFNEPIFLLWNLGGDVHRDQILLILSLFEFPLEPFLMQIFQNYVLVSMPFGFVLQIHCTLFVICCTF